MVSTVSFVASAVVNSINAGLESSLLSSYITYENIIENFVSVMATAAEDPDNETVTLDTPYGVFVGAEEVLSSAATYAGTYMMQIFENATSLSSDILVSIYDLEKELAKII